jgi:hypothetical protein
MLTNSTALLSDSIYKEPCHGRFHPMWNEVMVVNKVLDSFGCIRR